MMVTLHYVAFSKPCVCGNVACNWMKTFDYNNMNVIRGNWFDFVKSIVVLLINVERTLTICYLLYWFTDSGMRNLISGIVLNCTVFIQNCTV